MSDDSVSQEPRVVDYGPQRLIGVSQLCKTSDDCHRVWAGEDGFVQIVGEPAEAGESVPHYGVCRCAQGAEPGAFEYMAARPASDGEVAPDGAVEVNILSGTYAVFPVASLSEIGRAWDSTREWLSTHPKWKGFCDREDCGCREHPSFEMYPPDFDEASGLFIYVPIRPA